MARTRRIDEYFPLGGGLNEVTPALAIPPGMFIQGVNYEPWINGGYRRKKGFERFDGQTAPSSAVFFGFTVASAASLSVGDAVTGDTSAATGVVCGISGLEVGLVVLTGTFVNGEGINSGATTITSTPLQGSASTIDIQRTFQLGAEDYWRAFIQPVPGAGPLRGAWRIRDRAYAVRDNVGQTAMVIHKATASGWSSAAVTMAQTLQFDAGSTAITEGETVDNGSGASATVHRVILWAGSYGGADARGYLVLKNVTGAWADNDPIRVSAVQRATANGVSSTFALAAGGRCVFMSENYFGGSATYRVYCADGVNQGYEIDENDIVSPILLDLSLDESPSDDKPILVESYDGALWFMFAGGRAVRSVTGSPLEFNGFLGAADYGLGEEGTGLVSLEGDVLVAQTRRQTFGFFKGDTPGTYVKRLIAERAGAVLYSSQQVGSLYSVDDAGIVDIRRVEAFGDFANATVSDLVQPTITSRRGDIVGSYVVRDSNQYRIMYSDGTGTICRVLPDGVVEFGPMRLGKNVNCCYDCEDENGDTVVYFGGSDGYVYQAEMGRTFDGDEIESFMRLAFNHSKSPKYRKRYYQGEIEIDAPGKVELLVTYDLSYGSTEISQGVDIVEAGDADVTIFGQGGQYDSSNFNEAYFDAPIITEGVFDMVGTGKNVSILIYHKSAVNDPFILQGILLDFAVRRLQR